MRGRSSLWTASSSSTDQAIRSASITRKNSRGSSLTYVVSSPLPRCSTIGTSGRPLTALWSVSLKTPGFAASVLCTIQCARNAPVSLTNDSVCSDALPVHVRTGRQLVTRVDAGGFVWQLAPRMTAATIVRRKIDARIRRRPLRVTDAQTE